MVLTLIPSCTLWEGFSSTYTLSFPILYRQVLVVSECNHLRDNTYRTEWNSGHVSVITYGTEWNLRMSSVRSMAAVFTVFGHPTYQKLISNHISDLLSLPRSVLLMPKRYRDIVS